MKIGRNEPCPCGSGKKFKHCCLIPRQISPQKDSLDGEEENISNKDGLLLTYYVVCVIDILGQKEKLAGWSELPMNSTLPPPLIDAMIKTVGAVLVFQKNFENYFNEAAIPTISQSDLMKLPKEKQDRYPRFKECRLNTQRFSDTFVFYAPLANTHNDISVIPIYRILGACCNAMLSSLGSGIPIRGGICIGTGVELNKNDFYGPALAEAHNIESEIAQYPRVVVSERVQKFIQLEQIYSGDSEINGMMNRMANLCRELLTIDEVDGKYLVDFLGSGTRSLYPNDKTELDWIVARSHQFVIDEKKRFLQEGNDKLVRRYTRLLEYIESRLDLWGLKPDTTASKSKKGN